MKEEKERFEEGMRELLEEAEREGKWLWCRYQDIWFSPGELRKVQGEGRFRWGRINWELRNPREHLEELEKEAEGARKRYEQFAREIGE